MEWMSLVGINSAPNRRWKQAIWKFISPAHKRNPELDGPRLLWQPHIVLWDPRAFYPWIPLSSVHSYFRVIIWSKMAAGAPAIVSSFHVGKNVRLCLHSQRANKQLFFLSLSHCPPLTAIWVGKYSLLDRHIATQNKISVLLLKMGLGRQLAICAGVGRGGQLEAI